MAEITPTILVVDDDPLEGRLLVRALQKAGFQQPVQVLTEGEAAKKYLKGDEPYSDRAQYPQPSLVILDHRMPGSNGWEVLEWMREDLALKSLPVVVFSGSANPADQEKAASLGAAFQTKPQNSEEYDAVVKRIAQFWLRPP